MKSYFKFSKGQKIGVSALAVIIILQIIFLNKGSGISIPDPFFVSMEDYRMIDESPVYEKKYKKQKRRKEYKLSEFDPNTYSIVDWEKIGFSVKQSTIIVNYKNKIGGFRKKSDLAKVFVISEKKYLELEPFIKIKEVVPAVKTNKTDLKRPNKKLVIYELNSASLNELIQIHGIGEFTAKGIIKHRELIGGFHTASQLLEVYGIEGGNYDKIIKQLTIDNSSLVKVNINELSIFDLKKQHYISWTLAEAIVNKRLSKRLSNLTFLIEDGLLTSEELDRLLPYIEF